MFEENKKRAHWKTAVVERLITGRDEIVRGAEVRTIGKGKHLRISRPIQKLYPLEIGATLESTAGNRKKQLLCESYEPWRNPTRAAALDSKWKTKRMLDS